MGGRRLLVLAVSAAMVAAAAASAAVRTSAPPPKLTDLAVGISDLPPGTVLLGDTRSKLAGAPVLVRIATTSTRGTKVILVSMAALERTADAAYADFAETRTELGLAGVRKHLGEFAAPGFEWGKQLFGAKGARKDMKLVKAIVGRRVALGETGFWVPLTVVLNVGTIHYDVGMVYADRAFAVLTVLGAGGKSVPAGTVASLVAAQQHRLTKAFTIANASPPTISGAAQQGQTLKADAGTWTGSPTSFAYAWSRCDSTGATCTPVAGASGASYVLTSADSGARLRVDVTASNAVGSAQASSSPTGGVA